MAHQHEEGNQVKGSREQPPDLVGRHERGDQSEHHGNQQGMLNRAIMRKEHESSGHEQTRAERAASHPRIDVGEAEGQH